VNSRRGHQRLLQDCATVTHFLDSDRSPAKTRLYTKVGEDLALFLLATLRESEASIPHGRARGRLTRVRLPSGLSVLEGIYEVVGGAIDGRSIGIENTAGLRDYAHDWNELRDVLGVEIECARHPGQWWSTRGREIPVDDVQNWRCPNCAWSFRQALRNSGNRPPF
jgi:hypothetical protein